MCGRYPQEHPQVQSFTGRAHRTQSIILLMAKIYHSERTQSNNQLKAKAHRAKSRGDQGNFPRVLFQWNHKWVWQHNVKCCQLWKFVRDSVPRSFIGGWTRRHPLPGMYSNPRLPAGKQVFSINLNICTNRLSEPLLSVLEMVGMFLKSKFPDTSQGPTL